jgi:Family of unknown function (DUF6445)
VGLSNAEARVRRTRVETQGREGQPVAIVDGCLADPEALVALAAQQRFEPRGPYYPGIRAPIPSSHYGSLFAPLGETLRTVFGFTKGAHVRECNFSLVTTPPEQLQPIQRLPHYDGVEPNVIAVLIYLCGRDHGGTNFFRHKRTGFETVTADRFGTYRNSLEAESRELGLPPPAYYSSEDRYERIGGYEASFNRALLYRGITLHSGAIVNPAGLSPDPRVGRLTINAFLEPAERPK